MSTRERFSKKNSEFPIFKEKKKNWSNEDKEKLLNALEKYGYKDLDKISKDLPNKTKGGIRTLINRLNREAQATMSTRGSQVERWMESGVIQGRDSLIPQALKFISMFEKHPKPEESAGCDFRALYDVLSKVTLGYPPVHVSRMSQETISYVMAQAAHEVWPFYQSEITEYIDNLQQNKSHKSYGQGSAKYVSPKDEADSS